MSDEREIEDPYPTWFTPAEKELARRCQEANWTFAFGPPPCERTVIHGIRSQPSRLVEDVVLLIKGDNQGSYWQRWAYGEGPHRHHRRGHSDDRPKKTKYGSVWEVLTFALEQIEEEEKADES